MLPSERRPGKQGSDTNPPLALPLLPPHTPTRFWLPSRGSCLEGWLPHPELAAEVPAGSTGKAEQRVKPPPWKITV